MLTGNIIPTRPLEINVGNDNSIAFMNGSEMIVLVLALDIMVIIMM